MKKTISIAVSLFVLGILSTAFDMPYYWVDSLGEQALWKELVSAVFVVLFITFSAFSFIWKDRGTIRGLCIYSTFCLIGCIPILPWFVYTGLGLFQPAFSLLGRLLTGAENEAFGILGPVLMIIISTVLTWLGLIGIPPEDKMTADKAVNADKDLKNEP